MREVPIWVGVSVVAAILFTLFFCALLPLSGNDLGGKEKKRGYVYEARCDEPLGSDVEWSDTECYLWHGYLSCHFYREMSGDESFVYSREAGATTLPIYGGRGKGFSPKWRWGFSLGVGTQFYHYDWDVDARYQYFGSCVTRDVTKTEGGTLIPLRSVSLNAGQVAKARGKNTFVLNELDIDLSKRFHFEENLLINAILGVRNTWIKNDQTLFYTGGATLGNRFVKVEEDNRYWGIGPLAGVKARWLLFDHFYLLGEGDISLEYVVNHSSYTELEKSVSAATIQLSEVKQYLAPTIDLKIGCGLAEYVYCNEAHISLDFTYDTQFFYNRSNAFNIEPYASVRYTRPNHDVTIQGFALSLTILY